MNDNSFRVLLYSDSSRQAFSAAVYTASLLQNIPNMHLTILRIHESQERFMGTEYSWIELRPKYKRFYWSDESITSDTSLPKSKNDWFKQLQSSASDSQVYSEILSKTNEIFEQNAHKIKHQVLCSNISITDNSGIADLILDYSKKNSFNLIIMGTSGLSKITGLIFGGVAHRVLNKSSIPVLPIKKLPQEFINSYLSDKSETLAQQIPHLMNDCSVNVLF